MNMMGVDILDATVTKLASALTDDNHTTKIKSFRAKMRMRNDNLQPVQVELQWFRCWQATNESVVDQLRTSLTDRGLTAVTAITPEQGPIAGTRSFIPRTQRLLWNERDFPFWSGNGKLVGWKPMGGIQKATIAAGSEIVTQKSAPQFTYNPDKITMEETAFTKNYDYALVIKLCGTLGHMTNTESVVNYGASGLDCYVSRYCRAEVDNGLGQNFFEYNILDSQNTGNVEMADPEVPGMVQEEA